MSVVNKMLQDLESRQQDTGIGSTDYQPPEKSGRLRWLLVMIFVLVGAGYVFYLSDLNISQLSGRDEKTGPTEEAATKHGPANQDNALPAISPSMVVEVTEEKAETVNRQALTSSSEETSSIPESFDGQQTVTEAVQESQPVVAVADETELTEPESGERTVGLPEPTPEPVFELSSSADNTPKRSLKQLAQDALQAGDSVEAAHYLNQLVTLEPTNLPARKKLAALLFAQNQHKSAESVLLEGLDIHSGSAEMRLMLARLYTQNKQINKAHDLLNAFSANALVEPDYVAFRASLADQLSRYASAKSDYLALSQAYPDNSKWWLGLAVTQERLGESNGAMLAYQKANGLNQLSTEVASFVQQRLQFLEGAQ